MFCGAAPVYSVKQFKDYKHEDLVICKLLRTIQICNSFNNSSLLSFKNLLIEQNMYVKKRKTFCTQIESIKIELYKFL